MSVFTAAQQHELAHLLNSHAAKGNTMRLDEVQGFVLALLSGPDPVDMALWLPEILADEAVFTEDEHQRIATLVSDWAATLNHGLQQKQQPELVLYQDEKGDKDFYTWCNAYLYALDVAPTDWFASINDEAFEDLFYPVMALGGVYDAHEEQAALLEINTQERTHLQNELPQALLAIYQYWQVRLHKPVTVRHQEGKTGRNEPCPCGSGKKYKACCAQSV